MGNWKSHISSLAKSASMKLGILWRLRPFFFTPLVACSIQRPYSPLYGVCFPHMGGGSTHTSLLNRVESKALRLINSPPLTDCLQSLKIRHSVASLSIFYRYFHGNCSSELANCMPPPSSGLAAPDFLLTLPPFLSNSLMKELTSIFIPSSLSLVNSGTLFLNLYFHLPTT